MVTAVSASVPPDACAALARGVLEEAVATARMPGPHQRAAHAFLEDPLRCGPWIDALSADPSLFYDFLQALPPRRAVPLDGPTATARALVEAMQDPQPAREAQSA